MVAELGETEAAGDDRAVVSQAAAMAQAAMGPTETTSGVFRLAVLENSIQSVRERVLWGVRPGFGSSWMMVGPVFAIVDGDWPRSGSLM